MHDKFTLLCLEHIIVSDMPHAGHGCIVVVTRIYCLRAYSLGLPVIIVLQVNFIMNHKGKEAVLQISFQ